MLFARGYRQEERGVILRCHVLLYAAVSPAPPVYLVRDLYVAAAQPGDHGAPFQLPYGVSRDRIHGHLGRPGKYIAVYGNDTARRRTFQFRVGSVRLDLYVIYPSRVSYGMYVLELAGRLIDRHRAVGSYLFLPYVYGRRIGKPAVL